MMTEFFIKYGGVGAWFISTFVALIVYATNRTFVKIPEFRDLKARVDALPDADAFLNVHSTLSAMQATLEIVNKKTDLLLENELQKKTGEQ